MRCRRKPLTPLVIAPGRTAPSATPAQSAPDQPAAPTLSAGHQRISGTFTAPNANGSAITGYRVRYKTGSDSWSTLILSTTGFNITGLSNGSEYAVQVRASNAIGDSAWSNTASATPAAQVPDKPDAPTLTAGNAQIAGSFSAPNANGSAITAYRARYRAGSNAWSEVNLGTGRTFTIFALTNGTTYEVQVRATNSIGDSNWSDSASATPFLGVPDAPVAPSLSAGNGQITGSFSAPNDNGNAITGYSYRWSSNQVSWTTRNTTALYFTITGLRNGTTYYVQVRATNSIGNSAWSASASRRAHGERAGYAGGAAADPRRWAHSRQHHRAQQ